VNPVSYSPELDRQGPITPTAYQQLLGKGMDVDWIKTGVGMETFRKPSAKKSADTADHFSIVPEGGIN
jgi:hypothetical protein